MKRLNAYYESQIRKFIDDNSETILGIITGNDASESTRLLQKNTWKEEIEILKRELVTLPLKDEDSRILFEYTIPRMGKRVDGIVLYQNIVFVLEFKCGSEYYYSGDYDQVYDYALDLKNFHEESRDRLIVPILIATKAPSVEKKLKVEIELSSR